MPDAESSSPRKRLSRQESQARTRTLLLEVATTEFLAHGYNGTSLERVADAAGFSKGAVYGNFAGKDELVFAVANERIERGLIAFDAATPVREQLRVIVRQALGEATVGRRPFTFLVELDLYVLRRDALGGRVAAAI